MSGVQGDSQLHEIWPAMPPAVRRQIWGAESAPEPFRIVLRLDDQVPADIALKVFDAAYQDLPSWPSRAGAATFAQCVAVLAELDCVELEQRYHPLGVYLRRVADLVDNPDVANRLRQMPRTFASLVVTAEVDRIPVRFDIEVEGSLNAWATSFYHIDERLSDTKERSQLSARLAQYHGPIKLKKLAENIAQLARDPQSSYEAVVVCQEPPAAVHDCLRKSPSLVCVMMPTPESARRNLSTVVRSPVPFVLLSRSPEAVETLNNLAKEIACLRRFPHELKTKIAYDDAPEVSKIAAIVDLPEYCCSFDQAEQEPILNENL